MAVSRELLEILACPQCKGDVSMNESQDGLVCDKCRLVYEIRDDIPIMLVEEAKPVQQ
ncbi:MAG TPA: Trm112 family protein [Desulfobacteraceae bacterium]|nr:Trm112 family protein [Desulfobacteraceae bacterium]